MLQAGESPGERSKCRITVSQEEKRQLLEERGEPDE
jgi:hypothetical protein